MLATGGPAPAALPRSWAVIASPLPVQSEYMGTPIEAVPSVVVVGWLCTRDGRDAGDPMTAADADSASQLSDVAPSTAPPSLSSFGAVSNMSKKSKNKSCPEGFIGCGYEEALGSLASRDAPGPFMGGGDVRKSNPTNCGWDASG